MQNDKPETTGSAHTPGPWRLAKEQPEHIGLSVRLSGPSGDKFLGVIHTGNDEYIANARLIAAAPDLLLIAKRVAVYFDGTEGDLGNDARAAIAKATGSS